MPLKPTAYFEWVRRDPGSPPVLRQWWTDWAEQELFRPPGKCILGEWRDVPTVEELMKPTTHKPSDISDL